MITENQTQKIKAIKLAELLQNKLGKEWEVLATEKYDKFENAYKIELKRAVLEKEQSELNHLAISLTDRLVSPWLVYFDRDQNSIELIYNNNEHTRKRSVEFQVIKWAQLIIAD